MKKLYIVLGVAALFLLAACGNKDDDKIKPPESAEQLYREAIQKFNERNYKEAVKDFQEVERQHPSSQWAINAQIMAAYSSYEAEDYDTSIMAFERFVKLYPNDNASPYAYYMIALCYYEQISDIGRDQKITQQSMQALREVMRRFPDSEYARDAKLKLDLTIDHMAGKEMEIGRYYERHEEYLAAINRFKTVVENYQTTTHAPEALERLVECYLKLGVKDEAVRYASVLGANFPSSVWYKDSYKLMTGKSGETVASNAPPTNAASGPNAHTSWWNNLIP